MSDWRPQGLPWQPLKSMCFGNRSHRGSGGLGGRPRSWGTRLLVWYIVNIKDWDCFDGGRIVSNCLQLSRSKEDQREGWPPLRSPRKEKVFRTAFHLNVLSEDNRKVILIQQKTSRWAFWQVFVKKNKLSFAEHLNTDSRWNKLQF